MIRKIIVVAFTILVLTSSTYAADDSNLPLLPLENNLPIEQLKAIEHYLGDIIRLANIYQEEWQIDTSRIADDLSNITVAGGYEMIFFNLDIQQVRDNKYSVMSARDTREISTDRYKFILYIDNDPVITFNTTSNGENLGTIEGNDAARILDQTVRHIKSENSELFVTNLGGDYFIVYDLSGKVSRAVISGSKSVPNGDVFDATEFIEWFTESIEKQAEEIRQNNIAQALPEDTLWVGGPDINYNDFVPSKILSKERTNRFPTLISIVIILSVLIICFLLMKKVKDNNHKHIL